MGSTNEKNTNNNHRSPKSSRHGRNRKKTTKSDSKTTVTVDGFANNSTRRISICSYCAKSSGCSEKCNEKHGRYLSTSAGHWVSIQRKYKYKVMGGYRLKMYIRKCDKEIRKESAAAHMKGY